MTDISFPILFQLLVFFLFPLAFGFIAIRLKLSALVGYIAGGVVLNLVFGSHLPRPLISSFSMLGLVLLVFTIGLETNFSSIHRFGKFVLLGGLLQVVICSIAIGFVSLVFRFSFIESVFIGLSFAMSSTAIVSKIIQERGMENSLVGGLTIGVLIFQDLAFIPIFIVLSSFQSEGSVFSLLQAVFVNVVKAGLVLGVTYFLGQKIVPIIFNRIARVSREYLNLFIIVFILASLAFFSVLGLSSVLAAFIAGVLVGQTLEHYHIFSQIRPFRDLLSIVFFMFLGLTVQPGFLISHIVPILLFVVLVVLIKAVVVFFIYTVFKFHSRTSFALAVFLFEVGEDAFILLYQGYFIHSLRSDTYNFALSVVIITLLITPVLISSWNSSYQRIRAFVKKYLPFLDHYLTFSVDRENPNINAIALKKHVILCGYGRVGSYIGRALMLANISFIAIDYNFHIVEHAKKEGVNIIYGDPSEIDVLDYAECEDASVLISAVNDRYAQENIIFNAKKLNKDIVILTRVHREEDQRRMKDLGVDIVVQPEFEASLSIIRRVFLWQGVPKDEITNKIRRLKIEHGMT